MGKQLERNGEEERGRRGRKTGAREEETRRKENDSLDIAFLNACWLQNLLPDIKKVRFAHVFPTAGHSELTMASACRLTLWLVTLC